MPVYLSFFILAGLFLLLGTSANIVVDNIKKIGKKLRIPTFLLGLMLGILTSFPELSIAINTSIKGIQDVSVGNLFGGIFVVFCITLGLGLILNRKIKTDGKITTPLPAFAFLFFPLILGFDGMLSLIDGIIISLGYLVVLTHFYFRTREVDTVGIMIIQKSALAKELFLVLIGTLVVIISSNFIVQLTVSLLEVFNISGFMVGLMVFSLGTNLPELTVIITSWRKKLKEISFSHMLGSAIVNPLIFAIMTFFAPVPMAIDRSYALIFYFLLILSITLLYFYKSNKNLSRPEGIVLIIIFLIFALLQGMLLPPRLI